MFKLQSLATALILSLGVLLVAAGNTKADDPQTHEGVVVSAGTGKLAMTDSTGKQHTHDIAESVKITVNGKPGKLEDLKAGVRIKVMTDKDGQVVAVSTVDIKK